MAKNWRYWLAAVGLLVLGGTVPVSAQSVSPDEGLRVFKSANCMGCHKWSGTGGGSYGGAAANLRQTALSADQIEQTIRCGRLMTGMPHFEADAYTEGRCYGMKKSNLQPGQMPPEPDHDLRLSEIHQVATYVVTYIKGKGEPDLAQCQAFFGTGTRVCDIYMKPDTAGSQASSTSTSPTAASSHEHVTVDAAADANAARK